MKKALLLLLLLPAACTSEPPRSTPDPIAEIRCDDVTVLFPAKEILARPEHHCRSWVEPLVARTAVFGTGSAAIWSRRTAHGTGLALSAAHVSWNWFDPEGQDAPAAFNDPLDPEIRSMNTRLSNADGTLRADEMAGTFLLFHPFVPAAENVKGLETISPRSDFYLSIIDSQVAEESLGGPDLPEFGPPVEAELPLHDPDGLTTSDPTYAAVSGGDLVLVIGYPGQGELGGRLAASVSRVLDDAEAEAAIEELAQAGDEEGGIPYDPEAEMILEGRADPGMSGSGVFDREGRHVGIAVRASQADIGVQYVRAVRTTFAVARLQEAYSQLPTEEQAKLGPWLEPMP